MSKDKKEQSKTSKTIKKLLKPGEKKKKNKTRQLNAIKKLLVYLEAHCLELEGIFRVSGNLIKVKELKQSLEKDEDVDLGKILDQHTVSGALKMLLREMDEPLLTFDLYKNFLGSSDIKDKNAKISFLKSLLTALPKENAEIIQSILKFLYTCQMYSNINKMTSVNLSIVFAPTLLRPREESYETLMNATNFTTDIVKCLIEEYNQLYESQNTPILYKLSSQQLNPNAASEPKKKLSTQEQLDEANARIEKLIQQAELEAKERAVLETFAHQTNNRLQEEIELTKSLLEEKDGLSDLVNELKEKNNELQEKQLSQEKQLAVDKEQIQSLTNNSKLESENLKKANKELQDQITQLKREKDNNQKSNTNEIEKLTKENQDKLNEIQKLKNQLNTISTTNNQQNNNNKNNTPKTPDIKVSNDNNNKKPLNNSNNNNQNNSNNHSQEIEKLNSKIREQESKIFSLEREIRNNNNNNNNIDSYQSNVQSSSKTSTKSQIKQPLITKQGQDQDQDSSSMDVGSGTMKVPKKRFCCFG